jgi:hypothetical protein
MASLTPPPAGQAWPHAFDPGLVERLRQRAEQPGCVRHSQARALLSRHSRMTGGPPLAAQLHRRAGVTAGAWAGQPPIVAARPAAAATGPPPPQATGEGAAHRPAARARPAPVSGAATVPPMPPRPAASGLAPSGGNAAGPLHRSPAAQATAPPAAATKPAAAATGRPATVNGRPAYTAAGVTPVPMPAMPATSARAARGGPPGPAAGGAPGPAAGGAPGSAGGGLPGPVRDGGPATGGDGLPGPQLSAGPRQSGARPAVTAAVPHQPVRAAGIPASAPRAFPLVPPLPTNRPVTGEAHGLRGTPTDPPAGAPRRPVVRPGEGDAALPAVKALPLSASGEAGRPARPVVRERASGGGAPAFTLPKLLEQALLPLAHSAAAARLASAAAGTSGRSHSAAPAAAPGTGGAGQAQPAGRRAERDGRERGRPRFTPPPADLDRIVGTVQRRLMHQFAIERERRGMGR